MDISLTIAVVVRQPSSVHRGKFAPHIVGRVVLIRGIGAASVVGPSLCDAVMVVGGIVGNCGNLAAMVGGSSLKICAACRWQPRDYMRHPCGEDRWPIVGPCGNGR
jgi:hypothetical protein